MGSPHFHTFIPSIIAVIHCELERRAQRSFTKSFLLQILEMRSGAWLNIHHTFYLQRVIRIFTLFFFLILLLHSLLYFFKWPFWRRRISIILLFFLYWRITRRTDGWRCWMTTSLLTFEVSNCRILLAIEGQLRAWVVSSSSVSWIIHHNWSPVETWRGRWVRRLALFSELEITLFSESILLPI